MKDAMNIVALVVMSVVGLIAGLLFLGVVYGAIAAGAYFTFKWLVALFV